MTPRQRRRAQKRAVDIELALWGLTCAVLFVAVYLVVVHGYL